MKIVKQSHDIISGLDPMTHIERVGRICYKSEDKITKDSSIKFVKHLYCNNHLAMLEHYIFIMQVQPTVYDVISNINAKYFNYTNYNNRMIISFSPRGLIELCDNNSAIYCGILPLAVKSIQNELINHVCKAYDCRELFGISENDLLLVSTGVEFIPNDAKCMSHDEYLVHGWKSVHFITDRGISHELVRHRPCSFAQESTRYCNYTKDKFNGISIIDQGFWGYIKDQWIVACECAIDCYTRIISNGVAPQMARSVLPTCLKTELVITCNMKEWNHIFDLRCNGTTGTPHPLISELLSPLMKECDELNA